MSDEETTINTIEPSTEAEAAEPESQDSGEEMVPVGKLKERLARQKRQFERDVQALREENERLKAKAAPKKEAPKNDDLEELRSKFESLQAEMMRTKVEQGFEKAIAGKQIDEEDKDSLRALYETKPEGFEKLLAKLSQTKPEPTYRSPGASAGELPDKANPASWDKAMVAKLKAEGRLRQEVDSWFQQRQGGGQIFKSRSLKKG